MKLNIILLLVFINLINITYSQESKFFINFLPYNNNQCNGVQNYGIGYSIELNSCITIDHEYSFILSMSSDNLQVSWNKYLNSDNNHCSTDPVEPTISHFIAGCIPASEFKFNSKRIAASKSQYYKILITNEPYFPKEPSAIVSSYSVGECYYGNKLIEYYLNGTEFIVPESKTEQQQHNGRISYKYTCLNGKPYVQKCNNGRCYKPQLNLEICKHIKPFYTYIPPLPTPSPSSDSSSYDCGNYNHGYTGCLNMPNEKQDNGGKQDTVSVSKNNANAAAAAGKNIPDSSRVIYFNSIMCSQY